MSRPRASPENLPPQQPGQGRQRIDVPTLWRWVGSPHALGYPLILFIAAYPFLIGLLQEAPPGFELAINTHLFDALGAVGTAASVLLVRVALRWVAPGNLRSAMTAVGWLIAGGAGIAVQVGIAALAGVVPEAYFTNVPSGVISTWALLFSFTCVANVLRENAVNMRLLARSRRDLEFVQATLESQILTAQSALHSDVEEKLMPVLAELAQRVAGLGEGSAPEELALAVGLIRSAAQDVVRPLSHGLHDRSPRTSPDEAPAESDTTTIVMQTDGSAKPDLGLTVRQLLARKMPLNVVFNVPLSVVLLGAFIAPSFLFLGGVSAFVLGGVLPLVVVGCALAGLSRLTARVRCVPFLVFVVGEVASVGLALFFLAATDIFALPLGPELGAFFAFGAALVLGVTCVFCLLYDSRTYAFEWAARVNIELSHLVSRARQELWVRQEQIARLVHGSVQARLNAARLRLSQATVVTPEVIKAVVADLTVAREELKKRPQPHRPRDVAPDDIESQLEELADFWHGVCEVTLAVQPDVTAAIAHDAGALQSTVDVISEAVSNAVTHGEAKEIAVSLTRSASSILVVEVRNREGHAAPGFSAVGASARVPSKGMGSQVLTQLTHSWSLRREDADMVFRAEIILQSPAPGAD